MEKEAYSKSILCLLAYLKMPLNGEECQGGFCTVPATPQKSCTFQAIVYISKGRPFETTSPLSIIQVKAPLASAQCQLHIRFRSPCNHSEHTAQHLVSTHFYHRQVQYVASDSAPPTKMAQKNIVVPHHFQSAWLQTPLPSSQVTHARADIHSPVLQMLFCLMAQWLWDSSQQAKNYLVVIVVSSKIYSTHIFY